MTKPAAKNAIFTLVIVVVSLLAIALIDYLVQLQRREGLVPPGTEAQIGSSFSLIDQSGRHVHSDEFSNRYKLIFFGFTHCPDICPTTLARIGQILKQLGPASDRLHPLFITIDPERDTPERLVSYSQSFDPRIVFLTGSPEEITHVLNAWKATRAKIATAGRESGGYTMSHSSAIYLMTPGNKLAASYPWDADPTQVANSIRKFLAQ